MTFALMLAACGRGPGPGPAGAPETIRAADAALNQAIEERDLERIISFYADDALLLPAAEPLISGKAAIREEWSHVLAIPDFQSKAALMKVEISTSGDIGYSMGTYVATMMGENGRPVTEPGKWLSVWRKQPDGAWRIVVDIYNTDIPPPDHK
ncbi:MAG: YybH family protein [Gemmatimonadales bacterium]